MKYHVAGTFTGSITQLSDEAGSGTQQQNVERIKEWGVPGSKVKQRATERAEQKAEEERRLAHDVAHFARMVEITGGFDSAVADASGCRACERAVAWLRKHGALQA